MTRRLPLVSRVRDRLNQWETEARAAFSNQADPENGWGCEALYSSPGRPYVITPHVGLIHEEVQARHVKAWNPATVLTLVAGLRAVLDRHQPCHGHDTDPWSSSCGHWLADSGLPDPDETPYCLWCTYDDRTVPAPCPDLIALASAVGIPVEEVP